MNVRPQGAAAAAAYDFFFFFLRDEWPFSQRVTRADRSRSPCLLPNLVRSLEAGVEAASLARSLK